MHIDGLENDTVVIVGGSSGIGLAAGNAAVASGADVVIGSRDEENREEAVSTIGESATGYEVDISSPDSIATFLERTGSFDHLVLTAAYIPTGGFLDTSYDDLQRAFEVKGLGYFEVAQQAAEYIDDDGSVTAVSAISADKPSRDYFALGMANAAIEVLMRSVAIELSPVRANVISPSTVDTWGMDPDRKRELANDLPAGHVAEPEDVADAILFCMTNPHLSGETLRIDGGERLL